MSKESLEDLTIINFPKSVNEEEAFKILSCLERDLGCRGISGGFSGYFTILNGKVEKKYAADVNVKIISKDYMPVSFSLLRDPQNLLGSFSGLRFDTTVGYSLEEHNPEEIKFWRDASAKISEYFQEETRQGSLKV